jgi:hypothetical protein
VEEFTNIKDKKLLEITNCIYIMRDQKVMLDRDLALIYGVEVKRLNEQVKRNTERFPEEFCFRLTSEEFSSAKSQNATLVNPTSKNYKPPLAFTEQGAYALSFVLRSKKTVETGIFIAKAFTHLRRFILKNENLMMELKNNDHLSKTFSNFEKRIEQDLVVLYKNTSKFEKRFKSLEEEIKIMKRLMKK